VLSTSNTNITTISSSSSSSSLLFFMFVWNTWSFTSAPSRSLRDVMPRWKNEHFLLLLLRKTDRISICQIHSHSLFQFYQTMQGTKYLASWLIHWPLVRTFSCWRSLFLRSSEMLHSVNWWLVTDVSGPTIDVIFKCRGVIFGHSKTNGLISVFEWSTNTTGCTPLN
jgi:hypothetical protein